MTDIRNAQGNNLTEVLSDTINQLSTQFSEGVNAMFSGFKSMSSNFGIQGFAPNGQQTSHITPSNISTSESFKDDEHARMLRSKAIMDSQIPFGAEDLRAIGNN